MIKKVCTICKDRAVSTKNKCVRCYYAVKRGSLSNFQKINERNSVKDGVFYLGGKFMVDKEDFERLNGMSWTDNGSGYAKNWKLGYLHRVIAPEYETVDHINRNTFDNRKENLREGKYINMLNTDKRKKPCPIHQTRQGKWFGQVWIDGQKHYIQATESKNTVIDALTKLLKDNNRLDFYRLI